MITSNYADRGSKITVRGFEKSQIPAREPYRDLAPSHASPALHVINHSARAYIGGGNHLSFKVKGQHRYITHASVYIRGRRKILHSAYRDKGESAEQSSSEERERESRRDLLYIPRWRRRG